MIPERVARLPKDKRGYPIPWNVLKGDDGTPFFTINNDQLHRRAMKESLCPICGERLGQWKWFVGGPLSAFSEHGWYNDLPGHRDCMEFALETCPYLAAPRYLGRIDVVHPEKLPDEARILLDETSIPERPGVFVAVAGLEVELLPRGILAPYIRPVRPYLDYEYWLHGAKITTGEALPLLYAALGNDWVQPMKRHRYDL